MPEDLSKIVLGWDYGRDLPPERWGEKFPAAAGVRQSPIEIAGPYEDGKAFGPLRTRYGAFTYRPVYEQLHLSVEAGPGAGELAVGDGLGGRLTYQLVNFHFHTPSEHVVEGVSYPMEVHLVHRLGDAAEEGGGSGGEAVEDLAVLAVLLDVGGAPNPFLDAVIRNLPSIGGDRAGTNVAECPSGLLERLVPPDLACCRYAGSLTTPPCTENVTFFVVNRPVLVAATQIAAFAAFAPHGNNRPLQPRNGRPIWRVPGKKVKAAGGAGL